MNKQMKLKPLVLALGLMSVSGFALAELTKDMSSQEVTDEVGSQLKYGSSLIHIGKEAKTAGLNLAQVTEALIKFGQNPIAVVKQLIALNPAEAASITAAAVKMAPAQAPQITAAAVTLLPKQAKAITQAAVDAAPSQTKAIITAVLTVPGVNPADVLAATASGGDSRDRGESRDRGDDHRSPAGTPSGSGGGRHHASPA